MKLLEKAIPCMLLATLCACGTDLGSAPTVESDPIPLTTETAAEVVIAADKASDAPYEVIYGTPGENTSELTPQEAANRCSDIFVQCGIPTVEGQPWRLNYFSQQDTENPTADARPAYYAVIYNDEAEPGPRYADTIAVDAISGRLSYIARGVARGDAALRGLVVGTETDAPAGWEELRTDGAGFYAKLAAEANRWLDSTAPDRLLENAVAALGYTVETCGVEWNKAYYPETLEEFKQRNAEEYGAPMNRCLLTAPDGTEITVAFDAVGQTLLVVAAVTPESKQAAAAPEQAADDGWYEESTDGIWYHVDANGNLDDENVTEEQRATIEAQLAARRARDFVEVQKEAQKTTG